MNKWKLQLAIVSIAILNFLIGLLSNLAGAYMSPLFANIQGVIYVLLAVAFIASFPITFYIARHTSTSGEDAQSKIWASTNRVYTRQVSRSRGYKFPTPKIKPLPKSVQGKIAFLRGSGNNKEYVIARSDGSRPSIVAKTNWSIYCPRIAPGGEKVVFISAYEGREYVYIMDRDGSNLKRLTGPRGAKYDGPAAWSPDASRLIYTREYSISNDIYVMDSNGNNEVNITERVTPRRTSAHRLSEFPWSPDGQYIVFSSNRDGPFNIYVMDINGGNLRQITESQDFNFHSYAATWAPNRNMIAYVATGENHGQTDIFTVDLDVPGVEPRNITNNPHHNSNPVWSPEGTRILFVSDRDGNHELYTMNIDGSDVRRITQSAEPKENPSWLR